MARALAKRSSLLRIERIDRLLRVSEPPTLDRLATDLEVSPRTVSRDIELMRLVLKIPVLYDRKARGYRYADDGFQLPAILLTEGELLSILVAEEALRQYRGTPFEGDLESAFGKIVEALPEEVSVDFSWLSRAMSFRPGSLRTQDLAMFRSLTGAIRDRAGLRIRYHTMSRDETGLREVDPYHVANVQGDWYLIAHCRKRREVRVFLCARIQEIERTGRRFTVPGDFSAREFLAGAFSIEKTGRRSRVRIRFTGRSVRYVRERQWHASQKLRERRDGSLELAMEVESLDEVKRWVLGFGADAEVLSPRALRDALAEAAASMAVIYGAGRPGKKIRKKS